MSLQLQQDHMHANAIPHALTSWIRTSRLFPQEFHVYTLSWLPCLRHPTWKMSNICYMQEPPKYCTSTLENDRN